VATACTLSKCTTTSMCTAALCSTHCNTLQHTLRHTAATGRSIPNTCKLKIQQNIILKYTRLRMRIWTYPHAYTLYTHMPVSVCSDSSYLQVTRNTYTATHLVTCKLLASNKASNKNPCNNSCGEAAADSLNRQDVFRTRLSCDFF